MKFVGIALLVVGFSTFAFAGGSGVPEISPASGVAAITLVSGAGDSRMAQEVKLVD